MPAPRMSMRKLKEVLRLKWACGVSHRQISRAVGVSVGAVSAYAARAATQAGIKTKFITAADLMLQLEAAQRQERYDTVLRHNILGPR